MNLKHHYKPWEYIEIENFLPSLEFQKIQHLAKIELERYRVEGTNTRRGQYVKWVDEDILPQANELFDILPRRKSTGTLKKLLHWAITPAFSRYPTHIDNKSRLSTVTFYVSPENNVGTILCENSSTNDNGDHNAPDHPSKNEYEIKWQPNKVFLHCGGSKKWHRMRSGENDRVILSCFLVQPDLIGKGKPDLDHLIDLYEKS